MSPETEIWQVEVNGQIYETNFEELTQWIFEGAVLREDKVKRGNLRWLEAGKNPKLLNFFNAKDLNIPPEIVTTTNSPLVENGSEAPNLNPLETQNFENREYSQHSVQVQEQEAFGAVNEVNAYVKLNPNACAIHQDVEPFYICESCENKFCKACPKRYSSVKTCPMCGSFCRPLDQIQKEQERNFQYQQAIGEGFGFSDFGQAMTYPFKFKTSLIAGGIMFAFFTLGQSASALGGIIMVFASLFCLMLSNMMTFGILANTIENFSQGKIDRNFMPSFDDFDLWNDVIHPFFLSIGVYIVSFGLLAVIVIGGIWYVASSFKESIKKEAFSTTMPEAQSELNSANDLQNLKQIEQKIKEAKSKNGQIPVDAINDEEAEIQEIQKMIQDHRTGQYEAIAGQEQNNVNMQYAEMFANFAKMAFPFLVLALLAFLWAMFYFPAACLVAGYTRSFVATLNPAIGFDTIKRLGVDYFKILVMGFLLIVFSAIISGFLLVILSPFNLPKMGNLPATVLSAFVTFYISIVFSVTLGFAMYKNSHKFNIFR